MANIDGYISEIRNATYGREVRDAIANSLYLMNADISADKGSAAASATEAAESAETATTAAAQAAEIAETFQDIADNEAARQEAEERREAVETSYVTQAQAYAQQAQEYATSDYAVAAQSWAVGGTGTRAGEDANNARYWAVGDETNPENLHSAKWWSDNAAQIVTEGGVASFNGRTGTVNPQSGDYPSDLIPYGTGTVKTALDSLSTTSTSSVSRISSLEQELNYPTYVPYVLDTTTKDISPSSFNFIGFAFGGLLLIYYNMSLPALTRGTEYQLGNLSYSVRQKINVIVSGQLGGSFLFQFYTESQAAKVTIVQTEKDTSTSQFIRGTILLPVDISESIAPPITETT